MVFYFNYNGHTKVYLLTKKQRDKTVDIIVTLMTVAQLNKTETVFDMSETVKTFHAVRLSCLF